MNLTSEELSTMACRFCEYEHEGIFHTTKFPGFNSLEGFVRYAIEEDRRRRLLVSASMAPVDELGHFAMFDYPDGCSRPRWLSASSDGLALAIRFHEIYERLAPSFGYETRPDTKAFDPESKNGKLMTAVCKEILVRLGAK